VKVFLDANILVATLNKEYPLFLWSSRLLSLHGKRNIELCTSPLCLAITFYFASKKCGEKLAASKIELLCQRISITSMNANIVHLALNDSRISDFEDGMEYYSALNYPCDYIITENAQDFWFSSIHVLSCEEFLIHIQKVEL
jgi:predicted nucleic acid-binding protein